MFNDFFAEQCTVLNTPSELPVFEYITENKLENITFDDTKISVLIKALDPNKAHGWDNVSSRMIKISCDDITKPLKIIFNNIMKSGVYPASWKNSNVVLVHGIGAILV